MRSREKEAMKPKLYLETPVLSYLASRPSPILVVAGHQQITKEWALASRILATGIIPRKAARDAAHIA